MKCVLAVARLSPLHLTNMGWLRTLNLQRKVIGALTDHRSAAQTVPVLARSANVPEGEITSLLDAMMQKGIVLSSRVGGVDAFQLNPSQKTVSRLMRTMDDEQNVQGMTLLQDEHGWTAELSDPAGLLVRGDTREQAAERGRAVMQRMASPAGLRPSSTPQD